MHKASNKCNLLNLMYLFSLEYKEEILLYKLVIKLRAFSKVQARLVNINSSYISYSKWQVCYINICRARATRGSTGS